VLDHSRDVAALILSGSGALDLLAERASGEPEVSNFLNAPLKPARTSARLAQSQSEGGGLPSRPIRSASQACGQNSLASFSGGGPSAFRPRFGFDPFAADLPVYLFSGSEDPVGLELEGPRTLIERYRAAGIRQIDPRLLSGRAAMKCSTS